MTTNLKRAVAVLIILLVLPVISTTLPAMDIIDDETFFHVQNEIYNVSGIMRFSEITAESTYVRFNTTRFYVTAPNPINITIDFLNQSIFGAADSDKVLSFNATTAVGAVWFQITGFQPSKKHDVYRDGTLFATVTSDVAGDILFANTEWLTARYFEIYMAGGPPQVTVTVTDTVSPEICATIYLENEGNNPQEYTYYYFITPRVDGNLLDPDTVVSGWSSKLVAAGENFSISQCLTPVTPGIYWYKVWAYWGALYSDAAAMFTATAPPAGPGGPGAAPPTGMHQLTIISIDENSNILPGVLLNIYDGERLLGSAVTDEEGKAVFNIPEGLTIRIVATKEGYPTAEKTITVSQDMTETIQLGIEEAIAFPWWILLLLIIGGTICYAYKRQTTKKRKRKKADC